MTAPGHHAHETSSGTPKTKTIRSLSLAGHFIDRSDVKTPYIDTHCHLYTTLQMLQQKLRDTTIPKGRIDQLATQIFPPNCKAVVDIHCDIPVDAQYLQAGELPNWPADFTYYFAIGAHPHVAMLYTDAIHAQLVAAMSHPRCVAWGECGLDFFKNGVHTHDFQKTVFERQIQGAVEVRKPVVVHTRDADEATREVLETHMPRDHVFHVHCFTAGRELARWVLDTFENAYLGITGVVSYNLPHMQELIRSEELPLERMLLETDSPFMTPKNVYPWLKKTRRGGEGRKRFEVSHSGMIPFTAELVSGLINEGREARSVKGRTNVEEVLEITRRNAERVYGIDLGLG